MRRKKNKPKRKNKSVYSYSKPNASNESSIIQSEAPLLVFVSYRGSMEAEREIVRSAIASIPIMRSWIFKYAPASSQTIEDSYLSKVRECELFILLLGLEYSEAVANEYHTAVEAGKPILAFVKAGDRDDKQNEIVRSIPTRYITYTGPQDLHDMVVASVVDEVVRRFKSTLRQDELPKLIDSLPVPVRTREEVSGYALVGMEDDTMDQVFSLFGVELSPDNLQELHPSYKQVYFDNFTEMNEVFTALINADAKAKKATGDRQKAWLSALRDESLELASQYMYACPHCQDHDSRKIRWTFPKDQNEPRLVCDSSGSDAIAPDCRIQSSYPGQLPMPTRQHILSDKCPHTSRFAIASL
jgi:Domain of unknown function (DUF4062)